MVLHHPLVLRHRSPFWLVCTAWCKSIDCSSNCLTCSTASLCSSCSAPYVVYNNSCATSCPSTHYNMSNICYGSHIPLIQYNEACLMAACLSIECDANCTLCMDNIGCVSCFSPLVLNGTSCLESCASTTYATSDRICASKLTHLSNTLRYQSYIIPTCDES